MRRGWLAVIGGVLGALPAWADAQTPFSDSQPQNPESVNVGGTPTIDLILIKSSTPSVPLRNGGVIHGTERVQLNGKVLVRGVDYQLDAESGVIYLMRTPQPGQSLFVSYRYEPSKSKVQGNQFAGISGFKFELAPGGLSLGNMIVGLGVADRRADGNVVSTNLYGWNNRISLGKGGLNGLMMVGHKDKVDAKSAFEYQNLQNPNDLGDSQFIVEGLKSGLFGGSIEANYQDISKNFTGFNAAQDAGFDANQVNQFAKERGLKRLGLSLKDLNFGGLRFSNGFKSVEDNGKSIDWRSMGFAAGGLTLNWDSRKVEQGFTRFNDLAEGDRAQLQKEQGMSRENFVAAFNSKTTKMSLNVADILDPEKHDLKRSEFKIDNTKFRFTFGEQEVPKDFTRMNNLMDAERVQYGREMGIQRQWMSLEASLMKGAGPLTFNQRSMESETGEYNATDIGFKVGTFTIQHVDREASKGFTSFGAMQDQERNDNINAITKMYDPKGFGIGGGDVAWFMRGSGIGRSLSRISGEPFKGWNVTFDNLELKGPKDGGQVQSFFVTGKGFDAHWKGINLGDQFTDVANLMDFERARLGTIAGLQSEDFGMNLAVGKNRLSLSHFKADTPLGEAERNTLNLQTKDINATVNVREVDPTMTNINQLADPEKDLLAALRGFKERDIKVSWQILPNMKLEAFDFYAEDPLTSQIKRIGNQRITWSPDKMTKFGLVHLEQKNDDPLNVLFANMTEQMSLFRDFGKLGKLTYMTLTRDYDGTMSTLPDSEKRFFSYEAKLDPKTIVRTEQTDTQFENGNHENIRAHSVSTEVTNRVGVNVTDVKVDRQGSEHDEKKQNYGFWYDFGNGIRFSFGKARNLNGNQASPQLPGVLNPSDTSLAQMAQGAGSEQLWAEQDNEATTYQLTTAKPLKLFAFSDMQFKFGFDSGKDRTRWLRENKNLNWSAKFLGTFLAYDYKGQMAPNGQRASDRSFTVTTDQAETKPFRASIFYKSRELPGGKDLIIRNYSLSAKPAKNVELTHQLLMNPEVARGDVILGSVTQASQLNRWKLDVKQNPNLTVGGSFEQIIDQNRPLSRVAGLNITMNAAKGSPVKLFYGVEQMERNGNRYYTSRYSIGFDQKPGPNQALSLFLGNVSYGRTLENGQHRDNWTIRVDYQLKF